jgi:hypothetical protein
MAPQMWTQLSTGSNFGSANDAVFLKFIPTRRIVPVKFYFMTGGTISGNLDAAILNSSGTRLWSKGSTAWPAINTLVAWTVSGVYLDKGQTYWLGMSGDNTTGLIRAFTLTATLAPLDSQGNNYNRVVASSFPIPSSVTLGSTASTRMFGMFLTEV